MNIFKLLAFLLDYPDETALHNLRFATALEGTRGLVDGCDPDRLFGDAERQAVADFVDATLARDAAEVAADYVQTFDLTPAHSLHLTHHVFGEEKTRGPALVDLAEFYRGYGLRHDEKELPDYLPLMLEFASQLSPDEARVFLGDVAKVLKVLAGNLEAAGSRYAPLVRAIENYGQLSKLAA